METESPNNSHEATIPVHSGTSHVDIYPETHQAPIVFPAFQMPSRGPPPTYEEAIDPNSPPPTYDSLFGRVREVHKSSNGFLDFIRNLFVVLLGTKIEMSHSCFSLSVGCTIIIGVTIVVPLCMIVVGTLYFNDCQAERFIPIYLIVGGVFGLLKQLLSLKSRIERVRDADSQEANNGSFVGSIQSLINCFLLGWFVSGCFWVYHAYQPNFHDPTHPEYCNETLYNFSFWLITSTYITIGAVILCLCCLSGTAVVVARDN